MGIENIGRAEEAQPRRWTTPRLPLARVLAKVNEILLQTVPPNRFVIEVSPWRKGWNKPACGSWSAPLASLI